MALCDSDYKLIYVDIDAYGHENDAGIFESSKLGINFERNLYRLLPLTACFVQTFDYHILSSATIFIHWNHTWWSRFQVVDCPKNSVFSTVDCQLLVDAAKTYSTKCWTSGDWCESVWLSSASTHADIIARLLSCTTTVEWRRASYIALMPKWSTTMDN